MESRRRNPVRAAAPKPATAAPPPTTAAPKPATDAPPPPSPAPPRRRGEANRAAPAPAACEEIWKPRHDQRSYRYVVLLNKLNCLLVSDPSSDKGAVAIEVPTGYYSDPPGLEGLSQLTQSSILCGNPEFRAFTEFVSQNNGLIKAMISAERSSFYVNVNIWALQDMLNRFASFFVEPYLEFTSRETAIGSGTYIETNQSRVNQLQRHLTSKDHPYHNFKSDNWPSAKEGLEIGNLLKNFFESHYSANLMALVICGSGCLDDLNSIAENTFCGIKDLVKSARCYPTCVQRAAVAGQACADLYY